MRIIISFQQMVGFGGTETYAFTTVGALERLGHDVLIYTHRAGPSAEFARSHGIRVIDRESDLPATCDAVLAQDAATAYTMAGRYPEARRVFVAHSGMYPLQSPPQVESVCQAVVVMNDRLLRRTEQLAWHPRVVRLRQPIDLQRFCFRALRLEQRRPPRVLWLNNYGSRTRDRMLEQACQTAGLELKRIGEPSTPTPTPEHAIAESEIVVSLGRGALEGMAMGRATYVFGIAGGDGWVTADTYAALESDGFAGRALEDPLDLDRLVSDLSEWSEVMGEVGRDLVCRHHDADQHALALLELVEQLDPAPAMPPSVPEELARLVRLEWDRLVQAREAAAETARLRAELEAAERRLEVFRATRRYRLASLIAWPLERLRALRTRRSARSSLSTGGQQLAAVVTDGHVDEASVARQP